MAGLSSRLTPPVRDRRFRWTVSLQDLPPSQWLVAGAARQRRLDEKASAVAAAAAAGTLGGLLGISDDRVPQTRDALAEFREAVEAHWPDHTDSFRVESPQSPPQLPTNSQPELHIELDDLWWCTRHVAEDVCVLLPSPTPDHLVLTAGTVVFPSGWTLSSKLGADLDAVHAPVPGYQPRVATGAKQMLARLEPGVPRARLAWSLSDTDSLAIPARTNRPLTAFTHFRTERQTFLRLPRTGAVIFTIFVDVRGLAELPTTMRAAVLETAATAPASVRAYKGWPTVDDPPPVGGQQSARQTSEGD